MITVKYSMAPPVYDSRNSRGFIVLTATLAVSAIGATIAVSLLLLGVASSRSSFVLEQSNQAKALANACAENALNQLRLDENYAGNETIVLGAGECFIAEPGGSGDSDRTIQATGTVGLVVRRVEVNVSSLFPTATLNSWQEVAGFQ